MTSKKVPGGDSLDDYQAQDDARTLMRSEEIKSDKGRHKAAQGHAAKIAQQAANIIAKPSIKPTAKPAARPTSRKGK